MIVAAQPASASDIDAFERRHGVALPDAYRQFLQRFNGGFPIDGMWASSDGTITAHVDLFCSITGDLQSPSSIESLIVKFGGSLSTQLLPIANAGGGSVIFLSLFTGRIYYWDWTLHPERGFDESELDLLATDFDKFMAGLDAGAGN